MQAFLGLRHPRLGRLDPGERLTHFGSHAKQSPRHFDRSQVLFGTPLTNAPDIANARVLKLPDGGHLDIEGWRIGSKPRIGAR